jgi:hypothetical protein
MISGVPRSTMQLEFRPDCGRVMKAHAVARARLLGWCCGRWELEDAAGVHAEDGPYGLVDQCDSRLLPSDIPEG